MQFFLRPPPFTNTVNQYNAQLKNYQQNALTPGSVTNFPPSGGVAGAKYNAMLAMYSQLEDLNKMVGKKLSGRTVGGQWG